MLLGIESHVVEAKHDQSLRIGHVLRMVRLELGKVLAIAESFAISLISRRLIALGNTMSGNIPDSQAGSRLMNDRSG
jgi:hypothetical protein